MFGFLPHRLFTGHNGANTSGLSPRLWNRVTGSIMASDGNKRLFLVGDDFAAIQNSGTMTDLVSEMAYALKSDDTSNHTATGASDEKCGVPSLSSHTELPQSEQSIQKQVRLSTVVATISAVCLVSVMHPVC